MTCISLYIIYTYVHTDTHGYLCWEYLVNVSWNESWRHFSLGRIPAGLDSMFRILDPAASAILISVRCLLRYASELQQNSPPFLYIIFSLTNILWDENIATPLSRQWPPGGRGNVTNLRRIRRSLRVESTGGGDGRKKMTGWLIYARNLVLLGSTGRDSPNPEALDWDRVSVFRYFDGWPGLSRVIVYWSDERPLKIHSVFRDLEQQDLGLHLAKIQNPTQKSDLYPAPSINLPLGGTKTHSAVQWLSVICRPLNFSSCREDS